MNLKIYVSEYLFFLLYSRNVREYFKYLVIDNKIFFIFNIITTADLSMIKIHQLAFSVLHSGNLYKSRI